MDNVVLMVTVVSGSGEKSNRSCLFDYRFFKVSGEKCNRKVVKGLHIKTY